MSKRKISDCYNVRINVGNYQHIELTKYAEEEIEYSTPQERVQKEDALRDELIASLYRSMKELPAKLGRGVESAVEIEESIKKAIPGWLANNPVPNIANGAKKAVISDSAHQRDNQDKQAAMSKENKTLVKEIVFETSVATTDCPSEELFENDEQPASPTSFNSKTTPVKSSPADDTDIFGDNDEDIFDGK